MTQTDVQTGNGVPETGGGTPIAPSGETLKNVLESLIFVSEAPVTPKKLARAARATLAEVQPLLDELVADYQHRGVHLYYVAGGYQFRSARESADFVKTLVAPKPLRLTRAQLETLAIVECSRAPSKYCPRRSMPNPVASRSLRRQSIR